MTARLVGSVHCFGGAVGIVRLYVSPGAKVHYVQDVLVRGDVYHLAPCGLSILVVGVRDVQEDSLALYDVLGLYDVLRVRRYVGFLIYVGHVLDNQFAFHYWF